MTAFAVFEIGWVLLVSLVLAGQVWRRGKVGVVISTAVRLVAFGTLIQSLTLGVGEVRDTAWAVSSLPLALGAVLLLVRPPRLASSVDRLWVGVALGLGALSEACDRTVGLVRSGQWDPYAACAYVPSALFFGAALAVTLAEPRR